jgi:protein-S-isoprenylcysteine O-methyltransferase Ste14
MKKIVAYVIVAVQLGCLLYIFISAPVVAASLHGIMIQAAGLLIGAAAIFTIGIGNFGIMPMVRPGARLVKSSIYRIVRHPMYLSLLLVVLALLLDYYHWSRLVVAMLLAANLLVKMHLEEKQLLLHFDEYKGYMRNTKRIIPFIY